MTRREHHQLAEEYLQKKPTSNIILNGESLNAFP